MAVIAKHSSKAASLYLMKSRTSFFALMACALLSGAASANTVVSVGNPDLNFVPGLQVNEQEALSVSWTTTQAYRNVSISVPLGQGSATYANPVYAFLTNQLGAGTTEANEIAHSTVQFTPANDPTVQVFRGLDLGPGTYYLTLWSPTMAGGGWQFSQEPSIVRDEGVTIGASQYAYQYQGLDKQFGGYFDAPPSNLYIPAAFYMNTYPNEHLIFSVIAEGDNTHPATTPEPESICLLGVGCVLIGLFKISKRTEISKSPGR